MFIIFQLISVYMYQKMQIVKLRYGEQPFDHENPGRMLKLKKICEIAKIVGVKYKTVAQFLSKYLRDGQLERKAVITRTKKVPLHIVEYLISTKVLTRWRHFTMQQRCHQLFFDSKGTLEISRTLLLNIYKANGVVRRKASFKFNRRLRSEY